MYCRIWSWSAVPCEKHGPRDSVDKNRGRRPRFLSLLRPEGHVFHTALETMIKSYYSTLADWIFPCFIHINMNFSALKWAILAHFMVAREIALLLWTGCQETQMNDCHGNLNTCFTGLNCIYLNKILVAMENFEKCTVAILRGPCSQHVTGNTSRLNQLQSAIIFNTPYYISCDMMKLYKIWYHKCAFEGNIQNKDV